MIFAPSGGTMTLPSSLSAPRNSRRTFFLAAGLAIITLAVFSPLFRAQFIEWDDRDNFIRNPFMLDRSIHGLAFFWTHPFRDLFIPITETIWWLLAGFAHTNANPPLDPGVFHAANVFAHIATVLVVFAILRLLVPGDWAASAGALLFAIHPLQVETVAWASGFKDLLAGLFGLLAVWLYLANLRHRKGWHSIRWIAATLFLVLALLSKPSSMVIPPIAAVIAIVVLHRRTLITLLELAPWFVLAGAAAIVSRLIQPAQTSASLSPIWARPLIAADTFAFYLAKLFVPIRLVVDYGRTSDQILRHAPYPAYWTWTLPAGIFILVSLARRKFPRLPAAALIFLAGLLPMLGLFPFDYQTYSNVADHYAYIAMLGPALAVAILLAKSKSAALGPAIAVPVLILLCALSFVQARTWLSDQTVFDRLLTLAPQNWVGHDHRWFRAMMAQDYPRAESDARALIENCPNDSHGYFDLGEALYFQGRPAEAVPEYREAIRLNPRDSVACTNLAAVYADEGRFDLAISMYEEALNLSPNDQLAREGLARVSHVAASRTSTRSEGGS